MKAPALRGLWLWCGVLLCVLPAGAELTAREVLDKALSVQDQVQDYTARCTLTADLPGLELPTRHFTVYFKRPGKLKVESRDLVVVPREALTLGDLRRHLEEDTTVSLAGVGAIGEKALYCIKLQPAEPKDTGRVLVWIQGDNWTPTRTEIWRGQTCLVRIEWTFARIADQYWMPTSIVCRIPSGLLGEQGPGTVKLTWQDYQVNTGLSDDLFTEQD